MGVDLHFNSGYVSAFYFVLLDLILFTNLDSGLARLLSYLYYKQIFRGHPLLLRSCDVPGITNFILGHRFQLVNVAILFVKLAFVGLVLFLDRNINNGKVSTRENMRVLSTFDFDPSDQAFPHEYQHRVVERRWLDSRFCFDAPHPTDENYVTDAYKDNTLTFYHIGFNLTNGNEFLKNETIPGVDENFLIAVNDSTIVCLSPDNVSENSAYPMLNVTGCSTVGREPDSSCKSEARLALYGKAMRFDNLSLIGKKTREQGGEFHYRVYRFTSAKMKDTFPTQYLGSNKETELYCIRASYSLSNDIFPRQYKNICLLTMVHNGTTLFERWEYLSDTNTYIRIHAGPIFDREIRPGINQRINYAWHMQRNLDWKQLSSVIVAEAMVYRFEERDFIKVGKPKTVTVIPYSAVGVLVFFTISVIVIRVWVFVKIDCLPYRRPQLNTIDGVSSIGREERTPSNRSLELGPPLTVGYGVRSSDGSKYFGVIGPGGGELYDAKTDNVSDQNSFSGMDEMP